MKKLKYVFLILFTFLVGIFNVEASSNELYNLDIKIHINDDASAHITETWTMKVNEGTEVYKPMGDLSHSKLTNFKVTDETGRIYTYNNNWTTNASLEAKAYKNGINYTSSGIELCWGMSTHGKHAYKIEYDVTNFVMNVEDGQIIYWKLVNDSMKPSPDKAKIEITSNKVFEDTVPVWGYGYKGYAVVDGGKIKLESETDIDSDEYMVLYANFEPNTFNATVTLEGTKDTWLDKAEEDSFEYKYGPKKIYIIIAILILFLVFLIIYGYISIQTIKQSDKLHDIDYGIWGYKVNSNDVNYFRDIPCKKDIFRAYFVASLYYIIENKEDLLGAVLLKWIEEGKVEIIKTPAKFSSKERNSIDLKSKEAKVFSSEKEKELYEMLIKASKDGILERKEFEKWCGNHHSTILEWFDEVIVEQKTNLALDGSLLKTTKKRYQVQPSLREEGEQMAGLKKFLVDFSEMKNKEAIEVHLWKEYLMYAQIFGIAKNVAKQFKDLYPEIFTDINYTIFTFIDIFSSSGISSATSARSAAHSYSSGGGGFSSGGGGGGSFGGGSGGGCR